MSKAGYILYALVVVGIISLVNISEGDGGGSSRSWGSGGSGYSSGGGGHK